MPADAIAAFDARVMMAMMPRHDDAYKFSPFSRIYARFIRETRQRRGAPLFRRLRAERAQRAMRTAIC